MPSRRNNLTPAQQVVRAEAYKDRVETGEAVVQERKTRTDAGTVLEKRRGAEDSGALEGVTAKNARSNHARRNNAVRPNDTKQESPEVGCEERRTPQQALPYSKAARSLTMGTAAALRAVGTTRTEKPEYGQSLTTPNPPCTRALSCFNYNACVFCLSILWPYLEGNWHREFKN